MEENLRGVLLADAGIVALVGTGVSWGERAQGGSMPAIVLHLISQPVDHTLDGPTALVTSRVQVDCWAEDFGAAKRVSRAVAACLGGWSGIQGGTLFQGIFQAGARDGRGEGGAARRYFRASLDFMVTHQQED